MAEYITPVSTNAEIAAWWATVPSSISAGDRYIAELTANVPLYGTNAFTGKSMVDVRSIVIRSATGGRPNAAGTPLRFKSDKHKLYTHPGEQPSFNANIIDGFFFEDVQLAAQDGGSMGLQGGVTLNRCVVHCANSSGNSVSLLNNALALNTLFISTSNSKPGFDGTGAVDGCTFVHLLDQPALLAPSGGSNRTFKNCAAIILADSPTSDPWHQTGGFSGSCSNNATSKSSAGACPGSTAVVGVGAAQLMSGAANAATLDARPSETSTLRSAGVASAVNGGIDFYGATRPGTPAIGAAEYSADAPPPASPPAAPTIGTATAGNGSASVTFTAPMDDGGAAVIGYTVTSSPGGFTGTGAGSPIALAGLTNGQAYTFTVTATNSAGTGAASAASNSVTPAGSGVAFSGVVPNKSAAASSAFSFGTPALGSYFAGPGSYAVQTGTLPNGLSLDSSTGVISGTPTTQTALPPVTIRVTDSLGATANLAPFAIKVS